MGSLKRLPKVPISLTSGIKFNGGVRYGGVAKAPTKFPRVKRKKCKVRAWMCVLWVKNEKVHGMGLTRVSGVGTKAQAVSMDEGLWSKDKDLW